MILTILDPPSMVYGARFPSWVRREDVSSVSIPISIYFVFGFSLMTICLPKCHREQVWASLPHVCILAPHSGPRSKIGVYWVDEWTWMAEEVCILKRSGSSGCESISLQKAQPPCLLSQKPWGSLLRSIHGKCTSIKTHE